MEKKPTKRGKRINSFTDQLLDTANTTEKQVIGRNEKREEENRTQERAGGKRKKRRKKMMN